MGAVTSTPFVARVAAPQRPIDPPDPFEAIKALSQSLSRMVADAESPQGELARMPMRPETASWLAGLARNENLLIAGCEKLRRLTHSQVETLSLLVQDMTGKEIAERMGITLSSVNQRVHSLREKFGARTTAGLVAFAVRHGFTAHVPLKG